MGCLGGRLGLQMDRSASGEAAAFCLFVVLFLIEGERRCMDKEYYPVWSVTAAQEWAVFRHTFTHIHTRMGITWRCGGI